MVVACLLGRAPGTIAAEAIGSDQGSASSLQFDGAGALPESADDPGFVIELDRASYRVAVWDDRSGELGPIIPVVLGSPANPTPIGSYPVSWVVLRPSWHPGPGARAAGARPEPSSLTTPMGVAKIPFAANGAIALHGGGDRRLLGRPISGGCVRAGDADLLRLVAWMDLRGALGGGQLRKDGEIHRPFDRPVRMIVR